MRYVLKLERQPDGRYVVFVPALGCSAVGDDYAHALEMARECVEVHVEGLRDVGLPVPAEDE